MKRTLAILLALCLAASASFAALAAEEGTAPDPVRQEQGAETAYRIRVSDLGDLAAQAESAPRPFTATGNYFGNQLTGTAKTIYDELLAGLEKIDDVSDNGVKQSKFEIACSGQEDYTNTDAALDAILKDHTELLYWMAKGTGNDFVTLLGGDSVILIFQVTKTYRGDSHTFPIDETTAFTYYDINPGAKLDGDQTKDDAFAVADAIVAKANQDFSTDWEKVQFFNSEICRLTSYDDAAAKPGAVYGDASQLTNVFLKKPVVCEGYAKAYKYLCDKADIGCYIVEGTLRSNTGLGNHMWNYTELDGKWYATDVTNNDVNSTTKLLAMGSGNSNYKKYNPNTTVDGVTPTNPDVTLSTGDYTPGGTTDPEPPAETEKVVVTISYSGGTDVCSSDYLVLSVSAPDGQKYDGKFKLTKSDVTVTDEKGKTFRPFAEDERNGEDTYYGFRFDPPLAAGKYTVSLAKKAGYDVTFEKKGFTVLPVLPDPVVNFSKPDKDGVVTVTIDLPKVGDADYSKAKVSYSVNDADRVWDQAVPATFTISATAPDAYPTKIVSVYAHLDGYEESRPVTASHTFEQDADAFSVTVTPVTGLRGFITERTLVATLSTKNETGEVTYELDPDKHQSNFVIEGDKVYFPGDGGQLDPTEYPIFVIATDTKGSEVQKAYNSAILLITEGGGGSSSGGSDDGDDVKSEEQIRQEAAVAEVQSAITETLDIVELALSGDESAKAELSKLPTATVTVDGEELRVPVITFDADLVPNIPYTVVDKLAGQKLVLGVSKDGAVTNVFCANVAKTPANRVYFTANDFIKLYL